MWMAMEKIQLVLSSSAHEYLQRLRDVKHPHILITAGWLVAARAAEVSASSLFPQFKLQEVVDSLKLSLSLFY